MGKPTVWKTGELKLDHVSAVSLVDQISRHIEGAIVEGSLAPGGRVPSCRDLAVQLGVARGTVKAAYDRLVDRDILMTAGAAGTRVVDPLPPFFTAPGNEARESLVPQHFPYSSHQALPFQMGVPAHDAFPGALLCRLHRQAVPEASTKTSHTDPRGSSQLREALASHLAIGRGIQCSPEQIMVTAGFRGGLALALRAIGGAGKQAWVEDPGYPATRLALALSEMEPIAVPVDIAGLDVQCAQLLAPDASLAIVTPGQQAPSGVVMSLQRRGELLRWAAEAGSWVVEDDYLADLSLSRRPVQALAAGRGADRVIHIGSLSKTISPALGVGFVVAPLSLAPRMVEIATWLGSSPNVAIQLALARFLNEGHYLRHLRRMRNLYVQRRQSLLQALKRCGVTTAEAAGLAVLLPLPDQADDERLAIDAEALGLGPVPLSPWFVDRTTSRSGLLLGVANVLDRTIDDDCGKLLSLIKKRPHPA
ncbi:MocR-like pyridoxine biosynthesis transcription factor PdxR [Cupriavidus pampae]|uniref:HTH-type transcriptional regulatory protein GabR n=1 Tax=Cupriavidus pampae TaxID=659251 RepID=A0ABN7Y064_9BURK|nr:PLP-dependent aminotransferase family protein [Cupriavidus pampae]CAG9165854.1 HTH-type transcriptional regulatory protein GabR [Cupriavidus pampae]